VVLLTLAPAGARAAASTAFVPQALADAANASPDQVFRVIVQGQPSTTLASLEAGVQQTQVDSPAPQGGINNAFASIDAVAAELTGQQILDLTQTPGIFAVTPDAPLRASVVDPPVALEPPTIAGTPQPGESLTASPGQWSGAQPLDYAYQWRRCDATAACSDIAGAGSPVYVVSADDLGSTLVVGVTATNADGSATSTSAATPVVSPPAPPAVVVPPAAFVFPSVTGTATTGDTLTADDGVWNGGPVALAQQWQRCTPAGDACLDVAGATGQTYLLGADDVGFTLRVVVTATNAFGSAATASNVSDQVVAGAASTPIPPPPPSLVTQPVVTGTAMAADTLTADGGTWSADTIAVAQQWQRCSPAGDACLDVAGATGQTYLLGADDVGATLRVVVTATNAAGSSSAASAVTGVVAPAALPGPPPPSMINAPTLTGTATAGETLTAGDGTWTGDAVALTRQWQRCSAAGGACVDIAGATGLDFLLGTDDVGSTLHVVVTATNASGSATAASSLTDVVAPVTIPGTPPSLTGAPAITGTPTAGETLTVDDGTWSGDAVALTQQWQRCSAAGAACVDIAGATGLQYVLGADDVGSTVRVVVTVTDASGSTSAATTVTAVVAPAVTTPPANPAPAPPVNVTLPTYLGSSSVGSALVAQPGRWAGAGGSQEYSFQWQRCEAAGSCVVVGTSPTYTPVDADAGSQLQVTVTADVVSLGVRSSTVSATSALGKRIAPRTRSGFWSWQLGAYAAGLDAQWTAVAQADNRPPAIAIVDSGVDPGLPGLNGSVVRQVRLSSLPQGTAPDGYGHGSFVAEVAAGHGAGEAGAAPKAPIVSLDVMNDNGMALTSDVVAAADWIYTHRNENGIQIRVANFSLIGSSPSSIQFDPLDRALERLWLSGIVVVTAAGNYGVDGQASPVGFSPANDPFAITVGASDTGGTVATSDDFAAPWSVYGHTLDGFAKPEIGAPGRYIVAPIPTDSALYRQRPASVVSPGRIQLSGTSFAAPLVAGVAANLLALHPNWTPDQVKGALMVSAEVPGAAAQFSLGVGVVDADAASAVAHPPNPNLALESFLVPDPVGGPTPVFDAATWESTVQADASWGTASWGTASWGTASWGTASWGTGYWSSLSTSTASWGTAAQSAEKPDNTGADVFPAGAYWMHWPY
jgi:hypothetical protein